MRTTTKARLEALDIQLDQWAKQLQAYDSERLNRAAKDGGWSAMQCLNHVMMAEQVSLAYLRKKLSHRPEVPRSGISSYLSSFLLTVLMAAPFRYKAPAFIATDKLPAESDLAETLAIFREHRKDMRNYLSSLDPSWFDRSVYKHPSAGRIDLNQMLKFFRQHFERHRRQALKSLKDR